MDTNTNTPENADPHAPLLVWQAQSKPDHERSDKWYIGAGICATLLIIYGLISGAWLMSVCMAICAGLYYMVRDEKHRLHSIVLTRMGVEFDGVMHPWNELKNFWMLSGHGYVELHIAHKKHLKRDIKIQLGDLDPFAVRDVLHEFIEQDPHKREKILDAIIRFCKL